MPDRHFEPSVAGRHSACDHRVPVFPGGGVQHAGIVDVRAGTGHPHRGAVEPAVADDQVGPASEQQQRLTGGISGADCLDTGLRRGHHHEPASWAAQPQGGERGKVNRVEHGAHRRGDHHGCLR